MQEPTDLDSKKKMLAVPDAPKGPELRHEILIRQVESKISLDQTGKKDDDDAASKMSFSKLYSSSSTGKERCMLYLGWTFAALTGSVLPLFFFFLGPVFDAFTIETSVDEMRDAIREIAIIMACLAVGIFFTSVAQNYLLMSASSSIVARLKTRYLEAVLRQDSAWFDQINYLEYSSRLVKECDTIQKGIGQKYGAILYSIFMCISGFFVAFYKGWSLALVLLAIGPLMMVGMGTFSHVMESRAGITMRAYGQSAGYAEQALSAIRIVVSFGQEELEMKNYARFLTRVTEAGKRGGVASGLSLGFFFFVVYLCYAFSFWMGSIWVQEKYWNHAEDRTYLAGDCIAIFFGVLIGLMSLGGAGPAMTTVNQAKAAGHAAFSVIDRVPAIVEDNPNSADHKLEGEFEFQNVDFYYPTRPDQAILKNLSITFKLGQTTAIVGPSGSGKSTVLQLVERFYDPNAGQVLVDGKKYSDLNLNKLRQQIGYVGQEPVLFNMSIKENILLGKPDASDAEIEEALKQTNAWDFVSKYPHGINSNVGAGGGQLSGGQKQRIALARAFIKKPRMLIFDEATSALDKVNEAEVQKAIDSMKASLGTVTTLVIAHRLSTIRNADRIVVMKKGQIVEDGSHDELLRNWPDGVYAKMNNDQTKNDDKEKSKQDMSVDEGTAALAELTAMIPQELIDAANKTKALQAIKVVESTETDPVAKAKMIEAEKMRIEYETKVTEDMNDVLDPTKASSTFRKRTGVYATPGIFIVLGVVFAGCVGILAPCYGWFIMETMNGMNLAAKNQTNVLDETGQWLIIMLIAACVLFFLKSSSIIALTRVSENITENIRKDLYNAVLRKDLGWHDDRNNSSGVMTATLASDVQLLNGVSSEGMGAMSEAIFAMLFSLTFGFVKSWPMALCCLCIAPFMMIASTIAAKVENEEMMNVKAAEGSEEESDDEKKSRILCADVIQNYKTVASLGNAGILLSEFDNINQRRATNDIKKAKGFACSLGLSVGIQNGIFGLLYLATGELMAAWPDYKYTQSDQMFIAMFVFIFGVITAAEASAMGPDVAKATKAATKIFAIIDRPSKIDVQSTEIANMKPLPKMEGMIEFRDVWFRYPARLQQWVFKGLNLKINPNDNIAVVGESGQGKSTFIGLIMRFYDPEFGQVLVDGVDVREYNVVDLRKRLGLVMQEPLLFNYTRSENILYGRLDASNQDIIDAATVANCREFIESKDSAAFDDDATALREALLSDSLKEAAVGQLGQDKYDQYIESLKESEKKRDKEGRFETIDDLIDFRDEQTKGSTQLHEGYGIFAGNRGSKLSGGQKQRIAIARAVIRNPQILLLDEATSALDEESQRLVQEALYGIMQNRTSIVVAHRLTTVERCSRLAVIEDGKIVEEGTFSDLTSKDNGFFANLAAGMRKTEKKEQKRLSLMVTK